MSTFPRVFTAALVLFATPLRAAENPYDILGKVLMPFLTLFSEQKGAERAASMTLRVEQVSEAVPELAAAEADFAMQAPDRVRLSAPLFGRRITLCRRGDVIWVAPGSVVKALLENPEVTRRLPEPNRDFKMKPFKLPLPTKQLVFLPALFQVRPAAPAEIEGVTYRGIDFSLMPELAKSAKLGEWAGSVWVNEQTRPVRLAIRKPDLEVVVRFEKLQFAKTLPAETWAPTKEEEADVLLVPPARYDQLLRAMLGERGKK
jgi:hypothetical protein